MEQKYQNRCEAGQKVAFHQKTSTFKRELDAVDGWSRRRRNTDLRPRTNRRNIAAFLRGIREVLGHILRIRRIQTWLKIKIDRDVKTYQFISHLELNLF